MVTPVTFAVFPSLLNDRSGMKNRIFLDGLPTQFFT